MAARDNYRIPDDWLDGNPDGMVIHWTGGTYTPNADDLQAYHILIDGEGLPQRGVHRISANDSTRDRVYAAHTRGLNTRRIGVALCAMNGAREHPFDPGQFPIRAAQWQGLYHVVNQLAERYGFPITRRTCPTHAEVEITLGVPQAAKWDVIIHPATGQPADPLLVGDEIRRQAVAIRFGQPARAPAPAPLDPRDLPLIFPAGNAAARIRQLQALVGIVPAERDGVIGPDTYRAIAAALAPASAD